MNKIITIELEDAKKRLDKFLNEQLEDTSRTQIQKMIKGSLVLVNGEEASVHKFLKVGDVVKIMSEKAETGLEQEIVIPREDNRKLFKEIKVIAEEKDFLIIEKPAGLLVHPTEREENDTLVDWLVETYPKLKQVGENPARPALVHRLDKEVSGLMLIPRNQDAFDFFKQQFKLRIVDKTYTALVHGEIQKYEDTIDFPISRSKTKDGLFAAHPKVRGEKYSEKDKEAITEFSVGERFKNFTLVSVKILTGRTHQIRIHMTAYGHPIIGDKLYFNRKLKTKKELNRIFLHATHLAFIGLDEKKYEFTSPLPEKLSSFLKSLRKI